MNCKEECQESKIEYEQLEKLYYELQAEYKKAKERNEELEEFVYNIKCELEFI